MHISAANEFLTSTVLLVATVLLVNWTAASTVSIFLFIHRCTHHIVQSCLRGRRTVFLLCLLLLLFGPNEFHQLANVGTFATGMGH